jgi:hypothetical protein
VNIQLPPFLLYCAHNSVTKPVGMQADLIFSHFKIFLSISSVLPTDVLCINILYLSEEYVVGQQIPKHRKILVHKKDIFTFHNTLLFF